MSKIVPITSQAHFKSILSSTAYLIVDFYADWCGPCKQIAPIFEQLATAEGKPGRLTFCKVNVDAQSEVAQIYGVNAMPTFLVLKGSTVVETVRGANATALRTAVLSAAASAAKSPARSTASFSGKGQALGSSSISGSATPGGRTVRGPVVDWGALFASPAAFAQGRGWPSKLVRFVGLYVTSLFSLEPAKAAEESIFAVRKAQGQSLR